MAGRASLKAGFLSISFLTKTVLMKSWEKLMVSDFTDCCEIRWPVWDSAKAEGKQLTKEEVEFLEAQAGAIWFENSQGFVDVIWFSNNENLDNTWKRLEKEYAADWEDEADD